MRKMCKLLICGIVIVVNLAPFSQFSDYSQSFHGN
uniref:Uncharacterized protein n=1 Tax=Phakopsora pachyrhizi TaxID=170000 RepID=A0A0S1MK90_PHAPC